MQLGCTGLVWAACRRMGAAMMVERTGPGNGMLTGEKGVLGGLELELVPCK